LRRRLSKRHHTTPNLKHDPALYIQAQAKAEEELAMKRAEERAAQLKAEAAEAAKMQRARDDALLAELEAMDAD